VLDEVSALGDQHLFDGMGMVHQKNTMVAEAEPYDVPVLARAALEELQLTAAVIGDMAQKEMPFGTGWQPRNHEQISGDGKTDV
jgi:hypothetical protein